MQDVRGGVVIHAKEQKILLTGIYKNSVEHKYSYCGVMYKLPAYGWSSTKNHIGVYFINPTTEYIGGGAAKLDLVAHMVATLLDYWTSGHYAGGAGNNIPAGESWKRVDRPDLCLLQRPGRSQGCRPRPIWTLWRPRPGIRPCPPCGMTTASRSGRTRWPARNR